VQTQAELAAMHRQAMDLMTEDLRAALFYPFLQAGLEGGIDQMRLMTAALPAVTAWVAREGAQETAPPAHDIQWVGYRLRIIEDENGLPVNCGLERTCQTTLTAQTVEEGREILADLIAPRIQFVHFRYHRGGEPAQPTEAGGEIVESETDDGWVDTWQRNELPLAVEITLGEAPLPQDMDPKEYMARFETFRRVVYIPGSTLPQATPTRR
jgi:hypothetical protein